MVKENGERERGNSEKDVYAVCVCVCHDVVGLICSSNCHFLHTRALGFDSFSFSNSRFQLARDACRCCLYVAVQQQCLNS